MYTIQVELIDIDVNYRSKSKPSEFTAIEPLNIYLRISPLHAAVTKLSVSEVDEDVSYVITYRLLDGDEFTDTVVQTFTVEEFNLFIEETSMDVILLNIGKQEV